MFITLAVFVFLCIFPIMLSQSLPFHMIKEKDRYIRTEKIYTPIVERIFLWTSIVIIIAFMVIVGYFTTYMELVTIYVKIDILVLSMYYLFKIGMSLYSKKSVSIFINYSLSSRQNKLGLMIVFLVFVLAILESMNIIL